MDQIEAKQIIEKLSEYKSEGVVILGPAGRKEKKLRVYCNGGDLGKIDTDGYAHEIHMNTDYADRHLTGEQQEELLKIISDNKESDNERAGHYLIDDNYLSLMINATRDFGLKEKTYKGDRLKKERFIETALISSYQKDTNSREDIPFFVYDMEYDIILPTRKTAKGIIKHSKPDFMVFDGERIGVVELKYDADSMSMGSTNSLDNHYMDFMDFIWNDGDRLKRWDLVDETIHRMEILNSMGLVPQKWEVGITGLRQWYNEHKDGAFCPDIFWIGFLFVEGPHKKRKNRQKKMIDCREYVETEVKLQLKNVMNENRDRSTTVRYGYCQNDEQPSMILDKEVRLDSGDDIILVDFPSQKD